ncbi:hypothetical protein [Bacteroides ovatus]|uniref:hypothetical protein n=1 Tax=Bacteroides ovatus TaxID=28116 RepID=UPI001F31358A|nr:hypothetical protein [Bacteroides ovatus]MCE8921500.1 hypothetical protein [Bacteroides ovatus]
MRCLFSIFSNRELALIVWLVILFLFLLAWNKGLYHFKKIIACVFATKLIGLYISLIIYISIIVIILWLLGFWNIGLLKDTIIWLIFSALGILFSLNKVKDATYFTNLIKSSVTIVVVVQFFINLYTFGFWVEFIMIPILAFVTMLSVYTEHNTKSNSDYKKVNSCLNTFFGITALVYIVFAVYETIIEFKTTNWIDVSKQFLLPIILTIVFIPFFWILALYMKYEVMFVSNNVIFRDKSKIKKLKIKLCMLYYGHFSFKRVHRIWNKMAFLAYEENTNYRKYIKEVAKPPLYKKSHIINKMRITPFNNIDECCKSLTSLQIGEFTEWKKLHGFDDFYCSTGYYSIKHYGLSNLLLSLQGEELYIHQLELSLSIHSIDERGDAILKFQESVLEILKLFSLEIPHNIYNSIIKNDSCKYSNEIFSLNIEKEIIGSIESVVLIIKSEM